MSICPFCGGEAEKSGRPCQREKCQEASTRVPLAKESSRGYPLIRKGWQMEEDRLRKQAKLRLLPDLYDRIRAAAAREGMTVSDFVERWAKTLPKA